MLNRELTKLFIIKRKGFRIRHNIEFEKRKRNYFSHIRPEIKQLVNSRQEITLDEFRSIERANSYEWDYIYSKLDKDALLDRIKIYYENSTLYHNKTPDYELNIRYDDVLLYRLLPLLVEKVKKEND